MLLQEYKIIKLLWQMKKTIMNNEESETLGTLSFSWLKQELSFSFKTQPPSIIRSGKNIICLMKN